MYFPRRSLIALLLALTPAFAPAQDKSDGELEDGRLIRSQVSLKPTANAVSFAIACRQAETQAFFNQAVAALHSLETRAADLAFYQATRLEPGCAMAWWGLALAHIENRALARHYLDKAAQLAASGPERERQWIAVLERGLQEGASEESRRNHMVQALSRLATENPTDHEAAAFLVRQLVDNRDAGMPVPLPSAVDALIGQVLRERPEHPIALYCLLLWEPEQPQRVTETLAYVRRLLPESARAQTVIGRIHARLNQSVPAIECLSAALTLHRKTVAVGRISPLDMPGYVETLDLLIGQLRQAGRVPEAIALARHLIELPAVAAVDEPAPGEAPAMTQMTAVTPSFASSNVDATAIGQRHLLGALAEARRWTELETAAKSAYLVSSNPEVQGLRIHALGLVEAAHGKAAKLALQREDLADLIGQIRLTTSGHGAPMQRVALLTRLQTLARELEQRQEAVAKMGDNTPKAVATTANPPPHSGSAAAPAAAPLAIELSPPIAPAWALPDQHGKHLAPKPRQTGPMLVVFYRGAGCPHCIEQLAALAPLAEQFEQIGITLYGVSTDTVEGLRESYSAVGAKTALPFPLVSDHALATFRAYGAVDARSGEALHGLFLIDGQGGIRWQTISAEPFMAVKSLLAEAQRTLPLWSASPPALTQASARSP